MVEPYLPALLCATLADFEVPCVDGQQQFTGYGYPGLLTQHPTGTEDYSIRGKFVVSFGSCSRSWQQRGVLGSHLHDGGCDVTLSKFIVT